MAHLRRAGFSFLTATQFLTRIPVPAVPFEANSLSRSAGFFPLIGAIVGGGAALLHLLLAPHLPRPLAALFVLLYLVLITGGLHEDGLADAADGFGGGTSRDKTLAILRDSRIGSYGGIALCFSLLGRVLLLESLPLSQVSHYLIAAGVLCRWTILPLGYFLRAARTAEADGVDGQGAQVAERITLAALAGGTIFSFAVTVMLLRTHAAPAILTSTLVAWLTGMFYRRRIGGITGDCFGATIQLTEIGVYLCGVWTL